MEEGLAKVKASKKRERSDTFWNYSEEDNGTFFDSIFEGTNPNYYLDSSVVKLDWKGRTKYCWQLMSVKTGKPASTVRSTKPYRLALVWAVTTRPEKFGQMRIDTLKTTLPTIKTKRGDHCRHRCGNDWCCNPRHIQIGTRVSNEQDKHFHYFLNHPNQEVRDRFRATFPDLMKKQKVW